MEGIALDSASSPCVISPTRDDVIIIDRGNPKHSEKSLLQTTLTTANPR